MAQKKKLNQKGGPGTIAIQINGEIVGYIPITIPPTYYDGLLCRMQLKTPQQELATKPINNN